MKARQWLKNTEQTERSSPKNALLMFLSTLWIFFHFFSSFILISWAKQKREKRNFHLDFRFLKSSRHLFLLFFLSFKPSSKNSDFLFKKSLEMMVFPLPGYSSWIMWNETIKKVVVSPLFFLSLSFSLERSQWHRAPLKFRLAIRLIE